MYRVLYRKWRPAVFDDVAGQEHITITLKNELKTQRINHAYLFTGSRGTGKTTCAKILSKAVNCLDLREGNPCGICENCRCIESDSTLDVIEMDGASNRRIDDIRGIIDEVQFTPAKVKRRVYIIDEVHMLTAEAFNALLKTLEEPPAHVVFILATTEVHKLPLTIMSRCQRFDFHRINPVDISKRLRFIAQEENINISDEALMLIAAIADGALRDALSLLDRCMGLSSDITDQTVASAVGLAQQAYLFDLADCCIDKKCEQALSMLHRLYNESKNMERLCDELANHFRNLMMIKTVKKPRDMVVMSDADFKTAEIQAERIMLPEIVYIMDVLQCAYEKMSKGASNKIEMEIALIKLTSQVLKTDNESLLTRIAALERLVNKLTADLRPLAAGKLNSDESVLPQNQKPESVKSLYEGSGSQYEGSADFNQGKSEYKKLQTPQNLYEDAVKFNQWADVINSLKQYSRAIAAAFEGTNAYVSGNYILIESDTDIPFQLLKQSAQRDKMRVVLKEVTGKEYRLGPYNKPSSQQEDSSDPLNELIAQIQGSGIEVEGV